MAGPKFINQDVLNTYIQAGIDPKTKLPLKCLDVSLTLKEDIKKQLRIIDEQDAVNRYIWYNLPDGLTSQELERLLYYKGQLCFFYFKEIDKFLFLPYALNGELDFYGRFLTVKPVPITQGTTNEEKAQVSRQAALLSMLSLTVLYDIPTTPLDNDKDYCVLLSDYTKQLSQIIIPRQQLQDSLLDVMSECIPFMRTALLNSTGIQGMRVTNDDEYSNVEAASRSINKAALTGKKYVAIVGQTEFQDLTSGATSKGEEFLMAMQSLDNFRLDTYGIENGGLFEKKQYQNNAQTALNSGGQIGSPLYDGLAIRQHFCDVVNFLTGLGISCDIAEVAANSDNNMDGKPYDEQDMTGTSEGEQPQEAIEND